MNPTEVSLTWKDVLLVTGPLVGVILGGLITSVAKVLELRFVKKRAKQDAQIERLTSISSKLINVSHSASNLGLALRNAVDRGDLQKGLDSLNALIQSLFEIVNEVDIVVPALNHRCVDLLSAHQEYTAAESTLLKTPQSYESLMIFRNAAMEAGTKLTRAILELRHDINVEIRRLDAL